MEVSETTSPCARSKRSVCAHRDARVLVQDRRCTKSLERFYRHRDELMGATERMEDLVRRYCGGRDVQGNPHTLADDVRMGSLKTLLREAVGKHVQMLRARLTSYVVLKEKFKNKL